MRFCSSAVIAVAVVGTSVRAFSPGGSIPSKKSIPKTKTKFDAIAIPLPDQQQQQQQQQQLTDITISRPPLAPQDEWIGKLDYQAFAADVAALGKKLQRNTGPEDVEHLSKLVNWRNWAALLGIATMWLPANPLTIAALSTWTYMSWTMIAHHTCHGGYNRVDAGKFNSRGFALGSIQRRVSDWLDWMMPEAWNIEHNRLHHYRLNEINDPDLVQRNAGFLRDMPVPMFVKYGVVAVLAASWKWFYYAPNTYKELQVAQWNREGKPMPEGFDPEDAITLLSLARGGTGPYDEQKVKAIREVVKPSEFYRKVMAPFFIMRYVLLPAPLLLIPGAGAALFGHAVVNLMAAELVTNLHSFLTIVTNHAGGDLYTFDDAVKPKTPSFYVRQIVGSANYKYGDDVQDALHGWLNYQVEHHVWPDFSMLQYQKGAPQLRAICEKHGVPYIQESVWTRLIKTVDVMVGKATMRPFPTSYEPSKDKAATVTWKSTNGAIDEEEE